jgi:hypothetical protein
MKVAIYGDSFACINTKWDVGLDNFHLGLSWVEILERNGYEITNFAQSGTAFMFSYEKFLKEHKNYDLNIFVLTAPQRIYIKALDGIKIFGNLSWPDSEYERVKQLPFYPRKDIHLEILKSVKTYLELWVDQEMVTHTRHVLVNNLWNLAPNTIVIPAFSDSMAQTDINLFYVSKHELKLVDEQAYKKFDFGYLDCRRKCHLSNENNVVLGNKVLDAIANKQKIVTLHTDESVKPANNDFYFYVRQNNLDSFENISLGNIDDI